MKPMNIPIVGDVFIDSNGSLCGTDNNGKTVTIANSSDITISNNSNNNSYHKDKKHSYLLRAPIPQKGDKELLDIFHYSNFAFDSKTYYLYLQNPVNPLDYVNIRGSLTLEANSPIDQFRENSCCIGSSVGDVAFRLIFKSRLIYSEYREPIIYTEANPLDNWSEYFNF